MKSSQSRYLSSNSPGQWLPLSNLPLARLKQLGQGIYVVGRSVVGLQSDPSACKRLKVFPVPAPSTPQRSGVARTSHPYDALLDPELSLGQMRPRNPNTRIGIEYACDAVVRKTDLKHDAKCLGGTKRLRFPPCFVSPGSTELDLTPSSRPAQYRPSRSYFRFKPGDYFRKNLRLTQ